VLCVTLRLIYNPKQKSITQKYNDAVLKYKPHSIQLFK